MSAAGLTVTVTVNTGPVQGPCGDDGVTLYIADTATDVVLASKSFNVDWPVCPPDVPDSPAPSVGGAQEYVVPAGMTDAVGVYENPKLLHAVVLCEAILACGLTIR